MHLDKKMLHKLFILAAACIAFAWLLLDTARAGVVFSTVWNLFAPFVAGAGIAFVFNVPMRAIERQLDGIRKPGIRRGLAILLTIAALVLVIMFVVELLVPQIRLTAASLSERIPAFIEKTAAQLMVLMEEYPSAKEWIQDFLDLESLDWNQILKNVLTFLGDKASTMMGGAVNVIGSVTNGIVNTVIGIAFAMYCLARKEILARQGRRLMYSLIPEKAADEIVRILRLTNATFSNFISGQCLEACILGCMFALSMLICRMPYAPLISLVIAVTALIPIFGSFLGCAVGVLLILTVNPGQALWFIVLFLCLQQIGGNFIYPRVVGNSVGLPAIWVLAAVTLGGRMFGVLGMLVMIPACSVAYALLRQGTERRLRRKRIRKQEP